MGKKMKSLAAKINVSTRCFACSIETWKIYLKNVLTKSRKKKLGIISETKKPRESNLSNPNEIRYFDLIVKAANTFKLDPNLVAAIVATESSFDQYAMRYEKHYKWLFKPEKYAHDWKVTIDTSEKLQKFSYGLMQIMGATCLEQGFVGFLPTLCTNPEVGLYWGCSYFSHLFKKHGNLEKAIASYNAGSPKRAPNGLFVNQVYVDKVLTKHREYRRAYGTTTSSTS